MKRREVQLTDQIARRLSKASMEYEREPNIGGLRPDFIVHGPEGQIVVVKAKGWTSRGGSTARAAEHVERYKEATGADRAFVVLWDLKKNFHNWGVVNVDGLVPSLQRYFAKVSPTRKRAPKKTPEGRTVFAAMPFDRAYDDTYFVAMSHAAEKVKAACTRVDGEEFTGDIVEEIRRLISRSIGVIVDLSESRPNVLYEAGFAHALEKPSVHICSTALADLPFDVRNWNTIEYEKGRTTALRRTLTRRLRAVLPDN